MSDETLYDSTVAEKARKWDEQEKTVNGHLYQNFLRLVQAELNIMQKMDKGHDACKADFEEIERCRYQRYVILSNAMVQTFESSLQKAQVPSEEDGEARNQVPEQAGSGVLRPAPSSSEDE